MMVKGFDEAWAFCRNPHSARGKTRLRDSGVGASMSNAAIRSSYGPSDPSLPAAASGRFGATLAASR